jgi:RimJ/RimL family protein N-acetyltransferase
VAPRLLTLTAVADPRDRPIAKSLSGDDVRAREVILHDALTAGAAPLLCRAAADLVTRGGIRRLWLNLEDVKVSDVVGLAALLQTVRFVKGLGADAPVLPSAAVYRALVRAGIVEQLPLERQGVKPDAEGEPIELEGAAAPATPLASTDRLRLRQPTWDELRLFEPWAHEPVLDQMVGSHLLYLCRHLGPYHADFGDVALHDATSVTFLVEPRDAPAAVGFVRLHNIHLGEGFAFLETVIADRRALGAGHGVEASRLALSWAMDALGIRRVEAKVYAYNAVSMNALRHNGFRPEGVLRQARTSDGKRWDISIFAIVDDEMRAERARDAFPYMGFWPGADP